MSIKLGSIVREIGKEQLYVVVDVDIREGMDSCAYDRTYSLLPIGDLIGAQKLPIHPSTARDVEIRGTEFPLEIVDSVAPFEFTRVSYWRIRRAQTAK